MPHQRQVICDKVTTILAAANTAAGPRVYANRFVPVRNKELPVLLVYTLSEGVDDDSAVTAPRELTRTLELAVDGIVAVADPSTVDDELNALAAQIETAMHADPYLGGMAGDCILSSTEIGVEPDGDRLIGRVALDYTVTYRTLAPEAPAVLDYFGKADVRYNLGGAVHPDNEAHDTVVVQEP